MSEERREGPGGLCDFCPIFRERLETHVDPALDLRSESIPKRTQAHTRDVLPASRRILFQFRSRVLQQVTPERVVAWRAYARERIEHKLMTHEVSHDREIDRVTQLFL